MEDEREKYMSNTYVFKSKDELKKQFQISVKTEFLSKCPKPEEVPMIELLTIYKINQWFHGETTPAVTRVADGYSEFWLDGMRLSDAEANKIKHTIAFGDTVDELLS